jgi:hypothetical protein
MSKKLAIFYHALFRLGTPPSVLSAAIPIITEQMNALDKSGLLKEASEFHVGINDSEEECYGAAKMIFPDKAKLTFHGLQCRNECRTILMMEKWLPGNENYYVLYAHSKGASHPLGDDFSTTWRRCMMKHCVWNWRQCVEALDSGCDAAGSHFMCPPETPAGQYIFAGTIYWVKASFLLTLPSIIERSRIKMSGIDSIESRYEPEIILGNGPVLPIVKDFHPNWNPSHWMECKQ